MAEQVSDDFSNARTASSRQSDIAQNEDSGATLEITVEPSKAGAQDGKVSQEKLPIITVDTIERQGSSAATGSSYSVLPEYAGPSGEQSRKYPRPWKATFIRAGPISGILSMVLAISSIFACLGILEGSNGAAVSTWDIQPSEYLAIFTAIANLAMRYACIQGIVVAWWTRALRGSTLSKLHWDWRSGTTLVGALTGWRHIGWFGMACIFSTLITVDGPLLQRATHVVSAPITGQFTELNVTIAAEIPRFYKGFWNPAKALATIDGWSIGFNETMPTIEGSTSNRVFSSGDKTLRANALRAYYDNEPFVRIMEGCQTSCKAKLIAPALSTQCELRQLAVNYSVPTTQEDYSRYLDTNMAAPLYRDAFLIASSLALDVNETVDLITGWTTVEDCAGVFQYRVCTLTSAVGEYDVSITRDEVTLDDPGHPRILALANNTAVDPVASDTVPIYRSTLAMIAVLAWATFSADDAYYQVDGEIRSGINGMSVLDRYAIASEEECRSFSDPYEDVIAALNQMMVYIGADAAKESASYLEEHMDPGWPIHTKTIGEVVGTHNIYKSEFRFFIAAALVEIACILLVAPTYWGWWRLGRPCSFSPLEVAKGSLAEHEPFASIADDVQAFESPLLTDANSNSSGRDLARTVGEVRVRYGATGQYDMPEKSRLAFANPELVQYPVKDARFDL